MPLDPNKGGKGPQGDQDQKIRRSVRIVEQREQKRRF